MNIELTPADHLILESYKGLCDGLAGYLGPGYEIVLHSLEDFENSVVYIINGEYTGRKIGSPITSLALNMLNKIQNNANKEGHISYFTTNRRGEPLKSSTITIKGENNRIIGLLCINLYLNTPLHSFIGSLHETGFEKKEDLAENFVDDTDELISKAFYDAQRMVLQDHSISSSYQNKEIISNLYDQGIFNLKDSVLKVAEMLHISKNTVYLHLRNLRNCKSK